MLRFWSLMLAFSKVWCSLVGPLIVLYLLKTYFRVEEKNLSSFMLCGIASFLSYSMETYLRVSFVTSCLIEFCLYSIGLLLLFTKPSESWGTCPRVMTTFLPESCCTALASSLKPISGSLLSDMLKRRSILFSLVMNWLLEVLTTDGRFDLIPILKTFLFSSAYYISF